MKNENKENTKSELKAEQLKEVSGGAISVAAQRALLSSSLLQSNALRIGAIAHW